MNKLLFYLLVSFFALAFCGGCTQERPLPGEGVPEEQRGEHHAEDHEHGEELYEWSGLFTFAEGVYVMEFQESGDPSMGVVFLLDEGDRDYSDHLAYHIFEQEMVVVSPGEIFEVVPEFGYKIILNPDGTTVSFQIGEAGDYLVYMEHLPEEFDLKILDEDGKALVPREVIVY